jgi:hypothetical protein
VTLIESPAVAAGAQTPAPPLSQDQLDFFHTHGYLVVRGAVAEEHLQRFEAAVVQHPPLDQDVPGQTFPGPGRWTLARNAMADPDLAFLMARPEIVEPMRAVLEDDPKVIMFAWYNRTPGGAGIPSHNDYKRWRPIGSSMRWAFAIVPFVDFDGDTGPLEFAPGSHIVEHHPDPWAPVWNAERPVRPSEDAYVDPQLRRGDLAIVDMHTWHRAGANASDLHRTGLFTKWCAASQPPATGWFPYNAEVAAALGPDGVHILGTWHDRPIATTAGVITRRRGDATQFLFLSEDGGRLALPGGPAAEEGAIPDWDEGNYLASLVDALDARLRCRPTWGSYVGDYPEGDHLCRVYAYHLPDHAWGIHASGTVWLTQEEVHQRTADLAQGWEATACAEWSAPGMIRGKAVTEATGRADQYAC